MVRRILNVLQSGCHMRQKTNYVRYLMSRKKAILKHRPVTLSIVATSRCTLACDMCPTHSRLVPKDYKHRQRAEKDMTFELFKRAVDRFHEALSVHIIGAGEPMLNKDFFKMVDYAKFARRMEVKTFSNGTTVGQNIENLITSRLDGITISMNAHSGEEFSRLTGMPKKIFDKIRQDTKKLIVAKNARRRNLTVKLSFIVDRVNYRFLPEMLKLARDLKADRVFLCNFLPCPYGELTPQKKAITEDDREITEFIKEFKNKLPAGVKSKITFPMAIDTGTGKNRCDIHFNQIRVDGAGNVSSCSMMLLNMENTGNIGEADPWNSAFLVNMRKKFLENKDIEELCLYCPSNKGIEV